MKSCATRRCRSAPLRRWSTSAAALRGSLRATESRILIDALRGGQSRNEVARQLGISPRTLRYKLAQLRQAGVEVRQPDKDAT